MITEIEPLVFPNSRNITEGTKQTLRSALDERERGLISEVQIASYGPNARVHFLMSVDALDNFRADREVIERYLGL